MTKLPGFVGPSYTSQSLSIDAQRSINLYIETDESGFGKSKASLIGAPGLVTFGTCATTPVRGMLSAGAPLTTGARLFAVGGSKLIEFSSGGAPTVRGDVGDDTAHTPAQMFPNGTQLLIVSAGVAYIDNGSSVAPCHFSGTTGTVNTTAVAHSVVTWVSGTVFNAVDQGAGESITINGVVYVILTYTDTTHVTLSSNAGAQAGAVYFLPVLARTGALIDGYFIVQKPNSKQINISAINDGTSWNPLDFAVKEGYPDNIGAILGDHQELWLMGESTIEPWSDTGNAAFPFVRDPGAVIPMGTAAPWSGCRFSDGVAWIGADTRGTAVAYLARGFVPQRVSTYAIETAWSAYSTIADAIGWAQEWQGHQFWWITFPTANATWVYDATEKMWHERGWWNGSSIDKHRARCHAHCYGKHLVGDHTTGVIYQMSAAAYDDIGTSIHAIRTAPHISDNDGWSFFKTFRLDMENSGAVNPSLDWSVDGGFTFGTARTTVSGAAGVFARYDWRRLGRSRDRIFRITITAAVKRALVDAYIDLATGGA